MNAGRAGCLPGLDRVETDPSGGMARLDPGGLALHAFGLIRLVHNVAAGSGRMRALGASGNMSRVALAPGKVLPMVSVHRSPAAGGLDRALRGLAGLAVGTALGLLFAEMVGTLLAIRWPLPRIWAAQAACAVGLWIGVWSATRCRWPWFAPSRHRHGSPRRGSGGYGWVDRVVRIGLGACTGAYAGMVAGTATHVWLAALGIRGYSGEEGSFGLLVAWSYGMAIGAPLGLLWFALDLPWFAGRRRSPRPQPPAFADGADRLAVRTDSADLV